MQLETTESGPKWCFLLQRPKVKLWEAIAALVNIDTGRLKLPGEPVLGHDGLPKFFVDRFDSRQQAINFGNALVEAEKAVGKDGPIHFDSQGGSYRGHKFEAQISLKEVVAFFVRGYWPDIPAPLLALVPTAIDRAAAGEPAAHAPAPAPGTQVFDSALAHVQKHSNKTKRRDSLDPAIESAQAQCKDPTDTAEVWARLQVMAQEEHPPLLAVTPEGLKYLKDGQRDVYFTKPALDKRLHPEKRTRRRQAP